MRQLIVLEALAMAFQRLADLAMNETKHFADVAVSRRFVGIFVPSAFLRGHVAKSDKPIDCTFYGHNLAFCSFPAPARLGAAAASRRAGLGSSTKGTCARALIVLSTTGATRSMKLIGF
jgi:hypothetical protein